MTDAPDGLMLFDGVCRFCSTSVRLVSRFDKASAIRFTPTERARSSPFALGTSAEYLGPFGSNGQSSAASPS